MPIPLPLLINSIVFANLIALLSIGLTMTYVTTRVPNFAHGTFAMVGFYAVHTLYSILGIEPYLLTPVAGAAGALTAVLMYLLVLRPLIRKGASILMLMIATFAVDIVLYGVLSIYADILTSMGIRALRVRYLDTPIVDHIPVSLAVSTLVLVLFLVLMTYFLYRTKIGIGLRATVENPALAEVLGIDTDKMRLLAWLIAGFLAGSVGAILPYRVGINSPLDGSLLLPEIFAASIVGGLHSLYGAVLGGYIVGLSEMLIPYQLSTVLGTEVLGYEKMIPLLLVAIMLLVCPRGLAELLEKLHSKVFVRKSLATV